MFYWLINTAGIGGLIVIVAFAVLLVAYARVLRWINEGGHVTARAGGESNEPP
jgi:archaellin